MGDGIILTGGGLYFLLESSKRITNKYISITMDKLEVLEIDDPKYEEKRRKVVIDGLNELSRALTQETIGEVEPDRNYVHRPDKQSPKVVK